MWKGPGQDPGDGSDPEPHSSTAPASSQELSDLKDQFEQQEVLIAQLKELIRKSEQTSMTQEKVDEYMNTLTKVSANRAKKGKNKKESGNQKTMNTPAKEKINLLRQRMEENKLKLFERGKDQKGIEEMVTQLKAQLDDSQQLICQSPLNLSLQETKIDYSPTSTSEELYAILMSKEKKITELSLKVQKLEANVMDLQENLKEKDAVIDARTKAITLMTENLTKKGKNTLDTLDETREEMWKMQERFVSLESDMKARQMKSLDDLRLKNYEIAELREQNSILEQEIVRLRETSSQSTEFDDIQSLKIRIAELEPLKIENNEISSKLSELEQEFATLKTENEKLIENKCLNEDVVKKLQDELNHLKSPENANEEESKLRKQLEESNKNMIKVKAQHKSKVKELTKKIEAFKKISDANAELVKIEAENCRLNQKIAELEEEKGTLQLRTVETDPEKESKEKDLEDKIKALEEKDKIISILESEIVSLKSEIGTIGEKLNAQVSTAMSSIQFEEQMEALELEKSHLSDEKVSINREKDQLSDEIESLKRDKFELSQKLDSYIQENIDLVDKLEKLSSTEKVSSAESIEIVEGLTQQEKLELEAYQKAQNLKSNEDVLPPADLNDSVNELNEETSELLQKIELFTIERREVMEKMEQLREENNGLSVKIEEIQNVREVLAETYEQLQTEKENLDAKFAVVVQENEILRQQIAGNGEVDDLKQQISELQEKLSMQINENADLNNNIVELNRTLYDLQTETSRLQECLKKMEEEKGELDQVLDKTRDELVTASDSQWETQRVLESKDNEITKLLKERDNLQQIIREKDEKFNDLKTKLQEKYQSLQKQLETNSSDFESLRAPLEGKIAELTCKNKEQLDKMKKIAANLKKKTQSYQELEEKLRQNEEKWETESRKKDSKIETFLGQLQDLESANIELQNVIIDLRSRCEQVSDLSLQQELLQTEGDFSTHVDKESSLQNRIQELEMIVEERDLSLGRYKERVEKLEEGLSLVEERRSSLERRALDLGTQLEEKSQSCEQMSLSEDFLEKRLHALTEHDEAIERKLDEATKENRELHEEVERLTVTNHRLESEVLRLLDEVEDLGRFKRDFEVFEGKVASLTQINSSLENSLKELRENYDKTIGEAKEEADLFADQLRHLEGELENNKSKLSHNSALISDYDSKLQQANSEIDDLRRILDEKTSEIESLKQLETKPQPDQSLTSFFDQAPEKDHDDDSRTEIVRLNRELSESFEQITGLMKTLSDKDVEIDELKQMGGRKSDQSFFDDSRVEITRLNQELGRSFEQITSLMKVLNDKDVEIDELRQMGEQKPDKSDLSSFFDSPPPQLELGVDLQEPLDAAKLQIDKLTRELADASLKASGEINSLKEILNERMAEIDRLKDLQEDYSQNQRETAQILIDTLTRKFVDSTAEIDSLKQEINELRRDQTQPLHNVTSSFDSLQLQVDDLSRTPLESSRIDSQRQINSSQQEIEQLGYNRPQPFDDVTSFFDSPQFQVDDSLRTQLESARIEINRLTNVLADSHIQINSLKHEIEELKQNRPQLDDTAEKQLETLRLEIDRLTRELSDASLKSSSEIFNLKKDVDERDAEIHELGQRIQSTSNNMNSFFDSPKQQQHDIIDLHRELAILKQSLEEKNRELESFRNEQSQVQSSSNLSAFFDYGSQQQQSEIWQKQEVAALVEGVEKSENTNTLAELKNKIKTLEFMLYSVEKEKDDALLQCHEMSNELTTLLYERESASSKQPKMAELNSQIVTDDSILVDNRKKLQKIEYEQTNLPEVPVTTKDAYLCYPDSNVESQIVSIEDAADNFPETREKLQDIEFEKTNPPSTSNDPKKPIREDEMASKSAYLCYESGGSFDTFGENDDGWGWGPEESKSEEEHTHKSENVMDSLNAKIRVLELERNNHLEEIKQLQIKSGKLIKKLKEFKLKNEQLQAAQKKSNESDFFNLDDTIQEEFKLQINHGEKKLKEALTELEREKCERASILKKVELLTAANERLIELKEKQDVELLGWQRNYREMSAKLERFEWGDDGFGEASSLPTNSPSKKEDGGDLSELQRKINELNGVVKELSLDNEELQSLLEEQRTLRISAEKSKSVEPIAENMKTEGEYQAVVDERDALRENTKSLQNEVNELIKKNEELRRSLQDIVEKKDQELSLVIAQKDEVIERLNLTLNKFEDEDKRISSTNHEESITIIDLNGRIQTLSRELQEKNDLIDSINDSYKVDVNSLKAELETLHKSAQSLLESNSRLMENSASKDVRLGDLQSKNVEIAASIDELNRDWESRVDQRGNDVAESWKLHLESRETEFAQMENALRKELNEVEEKCNALVNENNELRRNVDAEIRNEVDRVSALQQQINDRQQTIVELTKSLQEKDIALAALQSEIDRLKNEIGDQHSIRSQLEQERVLVDGIMSKLQEYEVMIPSRDLDSILNVLGQHLGQIVDLKLQIDGYGEIRRNLEDLERLMVEKDQIIANQSQQIQNAYDCDNENTQNLQQHIVELQQEHAAVTAQLREKTSRLDGALSECQSIQLSVQMRDAEIDRLKMLIDSADKDNQILANEQWQEIESLKRRLSENENRYEELLSVRDAEIALLNTQIEELTNKSQQFGDDVSSLLAAKSDECVELQQKLNELIEEDNKQLIDLRGIIEEQVLKIESLKKDLFQKSSDFDSLIAEMDMSRLNQQEIVKTERPKTESTVDYYDDDLSEPVRRAELDLALYMLHQRDVRCEELTVELTQLLEERDTLQLRLSNAIREKEDITRKRQADDDGQDKNTVITSSTGAIPKIKSTIQSQQHEDYGATVTDETDKLNTKLSQLKSVGYKKDKTIVDEQEFRRFQELSIMQQHRDVASKLPPEAAARLVDASYTLSRDVQSPSKVLLNWLWGRSTPKVNNI